MTSEYRGHGTLVDPYLQLRNSDGSAVPAVPEASTAIEQGNGRDIEETSTINNDDCHSETRYACIRFDVIEGGTYYIRASGVEVPATGDHTYRITLNQIS